MNERDSGPRPFAIVHEAEGNGPARFRVLVLVPNESVHGPIPKITAMLCSALAKAGCDVVTLPWSRRQESEPLARKVLDRGYDLMRIVRLVSRFPPQVMLVASSHDSRAMARDIPLLLAMRLLGCPSVIQFHGSLAHLFSRPGHRLLKMCSRLVVRLSGEVLLLSSEECRLWSAFEPRPLYRLVANPYAPPPRFTRTSTESATKALDAPPVVLYVGRMLREKGVLDLVKALPEILQACEVSVWLVGAGPDAIACELMAQDLGVSGRVRLLGYLSGDALLDAYEQATVFAFPSYWPEGFPTVLSEAMAAGLPIVTSPTRGASDHLLEPENALFVPPRHPDALASAISRVIRDPALARRMGGANREKVKEFAPDVIVLAYIDALESAVRARRHGSSMLRGRRGEDGSQGPEGVDAP